MNYRRFGRTGWKVSEIGYGMWGLAGWTGSDDDETLKSLHRAVELGCNFFDTAWAYGDGKSEQILAKLLRETKNNAGVGGPDKHLYVATKIPPKNRKWPSRRDFTLDDCYPPEYVQEYVEKSLKNLAADTIDLMQFHTWEDRWLNDERLPRSIENMKKSGKVRAVGVSVNRWEPFNGIRAVLEGHVEAVQAIYNIFDQNPEDALFPICRMKDAGVIARVPFDEGTLTGTLDDGFEVASRRLAQYLFCAGESEVEHRARRSTSSARPCGRHVAGDGAALHIEQSRRQHNYSRDAQTEERGSELRGEQGRLASCRSAQKASRPSLGPQPHILVAIIRNC